MIFDMVVSTIGALMLGVAFGAISIWPVFERLATALRPPGQRATAFTLAPLERAADPLHRAGINPTRSKDGVVVATFREPTTTAAPRIARYESA